MPQDRRMTIFIFMWAIAALFHQAKPMTWAIANPETLLSFMAFLALLNPGSMRVGLSFLLVETWAILLRSPDRVTNHWWFTLFVNLIILSTFFIQSIHTRSGKPAKGLWNGSANGVRLAVLILYFFVVLHKLNYGFFDLNLSCSSEHYLRLSNTFGFPPPNVWISLIVITLTLVFEAGIPILLIFKKTRIIGLISGVFFHTILAINGYYDFSAMIFATYLFFLPDVSHSFEFSRRASAIFSKKKIYLLFSTLISAALVFACWYFRVSLRSMCIGLSAVYGTVLVGYLIYVRKRQFASERISFLPQHDVHYFVMVILLLSGMGPYLGLQTDNVFSMFSNLRTEAGQSNHLFIPASLQIFGYQRNLVKIENQNENDQAKLASFEYTHLDFLRTLEDSFKWRRVSFPITYSYLGQIKVVNSAEEVEDLLGQYSLIERKLMKFRKLEINGKVDCRH
jgi:hypothetical protein